MSYMFKDEEPVKGINFHYFTGMCMGTSALLAPIIIHAVFRLSSSALCLFKYSSFSVKLAASTFFWLQAEEHLGSGRTRMQVANHYDVLYCFVLSGPCF